MPTSAQPSRRSSQRLTAGLGLAALAASVAYLPAHAEPVAAPAPAAFGTCDYKATPQEPAAKPVSLPQDPNPTPNTGTVTVKVDTTQGPITLTLDRAKAPCTVQSFVHLANAGFFTDSTCHRITAVRTLKVLQCGDPSGTGEGGPGYSFKDELPKGLPDFPGAPPGSNRKKYARGVLAMANAGPNTNGSQFFMVIQDSQLTPDYTIFGTIEADGLATLDKVAAGGLTPSPGSPGGNQDGTPKLKTTFSKVEVVKAPQ